MLRNLIIAAALTAIAAPAAAQMFEDGYQFPLRNPSNMAVVIKQVEEGMFSDDGKSAPTSTTQVENNMLVCGGGSGGDSAATSNDSCLILNKTTGQIAQEQASAGNQSADSNTAAASDSAQLSEILEALQSQ